MSEVRKEIGVFCHPDTQRPGFDLRMELLATLPCHPHEAKFSTLVSDLRLTGQRELSAVIDNACAMGFEVMVSNVPNKGRVAWLGVKAWGKAQAATEKYWEQVYGGSDAEK